MADGVVPSNEDRGYVLRRIMRRAIQQGQRARHRASRSSCELCERVIEMMGDAYPELRARVADTIERWARAEEESFGRTLEQGERLLAELIAERARRTAPRGSSAEDAFKLHDTFGFPYEMTKELLAEEGLSVDDQGFEELMEQARERRAAARARARAPRRRRRGAREHEDVLRFAREAGFPTRFVGYETTEADTVLRVAERANGWVLAKLEESPFYPEGGGQVSDSGAGGDAVRARAGGRRATAWATTRRWRSSRVEGEIGAGETRARGGRARHAPGHDAQPHRHAPAARGAARAAWHHVRQAGSYVGPDKLRFDFTHGERLSPRGPAPTSRARGRLDRANHPVRAIETTRDEAERLGAMALFGEKYGDWVRMVEIEGVSRELCGGTHVAGTAEIGLFHVTTETSSASNVRRIEAVTGPGGRAAVPASAPAPERASRRC